MAITRQVSFLCNNYQYEPGEDPDNECILIPRYRAVGRVAPDGKRYGKVVKQNEADLVPVRSIITKSKERDYVTPDLLNDYGYKDVTYGSGIGMAMATGFTESTTQSLLGLKHGGHERVLDRSGYLLAPKACKLSYDDTWIYLKLRGKELKYPKPENIVFMGPTEFQEGDIVGTAYNTTSPIYDLNAMVSLMRARGSAGIRYFERDNVIISDCYAINSGTIEYGTDKRGDITVKIGGVEYDYNPQCMYYFPDGAQVNKFDRICSGVVNINKVMREFGDDIRSSYLIFRNQLYSIIDKDFRVNKVLNTPGSIQEEIIEMLFISLSRVTYDEKTNKVKSIEFRGTNNGIMDNDSFYTVLSWGYASKAVSKALSGELKMKGDLMTETILGLLLNDKLDEKK
jgi:hypothetical protein